MDAYAEILRGYQTRQYAVEAIGRRAAAIRPDVEAAALARVVAVTGIDPAFPLAVRAHELGERGWELGIAHGPYLSLSRERFAAFLAGLRGRAMAWYKRQLPDMQPSAEAELEAGLRGENWQWWMFPYTAGVKVHGGLDALRPPVGRDVVEVVGPKYAESWRPWVARVSTELPIIQERLRKPEPAPAVPTPTGYPEHIPEWARDAVDWVRKHDIMRGSPDGTWGPQDPVTRAQLAVIMERLVRWVYERHTQEW